MGVISPCSRAQETKRVAANVDARLEELEEESIADYVASFPHFEELHQEIQETDRILEKMEKMLGTFQCDLSSISDEIRMLQGDSLQMNMKLRNRRALQSLMSDYVNSVVVSPTLIRQICEEELGQFYIGVEVGVRFVFVWVVFESTARPVGFVAMLPSFSFTHLFLVEFAPRRLTSRTWSVCPS